MIRIKKQKGFSTLVGLLILVMVGLIGSVGWYVMSANNKAKGSLAQADKSSAIKTQAKHPITAAEAKQATSKPASSKTAATIAPKTSTPAPVTPPEFTNCLPPSANEYQKTYSDKTNTQLLQNNGYDNTQKFYDAVQFAGLANTVNASKTVVFAVNDYVFNNLTQTQKDYMNASPANMRAVLSWQIVPSCVIWSGNIENSRSDVNFQTLGGAVTHHFGSPGNIDGATMVIWDFFSSNGAMHLIGDFIKPPQI